MNNNCGRLQDFIVFFKIPMGTRKDFFEMYRKFGHELSERFTIPGSFFSSADALVLSQG